MNTAAGRLLDTKPKRATQTTVDTIAVTRASVAAWKNPPFQRPLRINDKVRALAIKIRADGGVLPGIITTGVLDGVEYLLDGQHRREAFLLSERADGYTDIRRHVFDSMAAMGEEFVNLNSSLVRLRPDDVLRGLEASLPGTLGLVRKKCPFVGYDYIRRRLNTPMLSMSTALRCWRASAGEAPSYVHVNAASLASDLTVEDAGTCVGFLELAYEAFGRDPEYGRLWGSLNLGICMWLYRHTVLSQHSIKSKVLTKDAFRKCLTSLSASRSYMEWLVGRLLDERDRSPAYSRIKSIFIARIKEDTGEAVALPAPAWSLSHPASRQGRT